MELKGDLKLDTLLYPLNPQDSTGWNASIIEHNKNARINRTDYKCVAFIYENLLNEVVFRARANHPNEISIEIT